MNSACLHDAQVILFVSECVQFLYIGAQAV